MSALLEVLEVRSKELTYTTAAADATSRLGLHGGKGAPGAVGILP
jgi:hypothetical protein